MKPLTSSLEAAPAGVAVALMLPTAALAWSYNEVPSGHRSGQSLGALALGSDTLTRRICGSSLPGVTRADVPTSGDVNDPFST